jgi:HEAT repeat protein
LTDLLQGAIENKDPRVRRAAVYSSYATEAMLLEAVEDVDPEVRKAAAKRLWVAAWLTGSRMAGL